MAQNKVKNYIKRMIHDMELRISFEDEIYREAFLSVERHRFVKDVYGYDEKLLDFKITDSETKDENSFLDRVYSDSAILYFKGGDKSLSSVSTPSLILAMINLSKMKRGDKVLEIGSGSGYSTVLFSSITGRDGFVCGTEISKEIYENSISNPILRECANIHLENSDGGYGLKDFGLFDRIIVSCTTADIPSYWVDQLKMGGMLVAPLVTRGYQMLAALEKTDADVLTGRVYWPVRFFPLSGKFSIISHYSFSSSELKSLKKIIEFSSETDELFSEEMRALSSDVLKSFLFFLSVKNQNAICYYPREDVGEGMGYGIFLRTGNSTGLSLLFGSKSVFWGNQEAHIMMKAEFNAFKALGMPNYQSCEIKVFSRRDDYPVGDKEYLIKRKDSLTLFSFK